MGTAEHDAELYDRYWQPVLDPEVGRFLEWAEGQLGPLAAGPGSMRVGAPAAQLVVDVGTGTGALLVAAAVRWQGARFVGLDPAPGMLGRARQRAADAGLSDAGDALRWVTGTADALPLDDGSADRVISSFVLQLVPDRPRVLLELARILRPGGGLAFVTWLAPDMRLDADDELDEAVIELGIEEREPDPPADSAGDYESVAQADEELRAAGFGSPVVRAGELIHAWTRESYLDFKVGFDEASLFEPLEDEQRARLVGRIRERWARLPDEAFVLRAPIVSALARRP